MSWRPLLGIGMWISTLAVGACSSEEEDPAVAGDPEGDLGTGEAALHAVLNTFITESLQIDQLNAAGTAQGAGPGDANLYEPDDPADSSLSVDYPTGGPATFLDWHELGDDITNHRVQDLDNASGKDPSSFPLSNECVAASQVLSKMDLTYIAVANNNTYAYFAVQRSANNGDAAYYWLLTRLQPELIVDGGPCSATQAQLVYDISGPDAATGSTGDVLIQGHFHPSSDIPLLRIFQAKANALNLTAVQAVDFNNSAVWEEKPSAIAAVAVNTTITDPGSFGSGGVKSLVGTDLGTELFAEAAIDLHIFTGGALCGATYWGSVITRSSGAGGTSPDLKDLAGPEQINFGTPTVVASVTPTCTQSIGYAVTSATDMTGNPIDVSTLTCNWEFSDGSTVTGSCSGTQAMATTGNHSGTVTVSVDGCAITDDSDEALVCAPLAVDATVAGSCSGTFTYGATPSGGCGGVTYDWDFTGPGSVTPASSTSASGSVTVGAPGLYTGSLTVTDTRTDAVCTASDSASDDVYAPIVVDIDAVAPTPNACSGDDVTWTATVSGGSGGYTYDWHGDGDACTGSTCTLDPDNDLFCAALSLWVTVDDGTTDCPAVNSETETYDKETTVTISNNP